MLPTIVIHRALGVILPVPLPAVQLYPDIGSLCAQEGPQTSKWCGQSQPTVSDVWEPTRLLPGPRELPKRVPCARLSSALTCSSYVYDSLLRDTLGMCDTLGNGHSFSCHPNPSSLVEALWYLERLGTKCAQQPVLLGGRTEVQDLDESCLNHSNHSNLGLSSEPKKLNWAFCPLPLR